MHYKGVRMVNRQIRDGKVLREGSIEVWEFDQNGNYAVQQDSFQFAPGDGFQTSCYYRSDEETVFGNASEQEVRPSRSVSISGCFQNLSTSFLLSLPKRCAWHFLCTTLVLVAALRIAITPVVQESALLSTKRHLCPANQNWIEDSGRLYRNAVKVRLALPLIPAPHGSLGFQDSICIGNCRYLAGAYHGAYRNTRLP